MKETTLVVMAAGMGSRYGGIKQLEPIGPNGEIIIDYSVYDAIRVGFKKVIFIIRKDLEKDFKEIVSQKLEGKVQVEYAFQEIQDIPKGYEVPEGRNKPWGTGQAILACRELINEPFLVINADDFYGASTFEIMHEYLQNANTKEGKYDFCMAGFVLENTLSENGTVTRGVCTMKDGKLTDVKETYDIEKTSAGARVPIEDSKYKDIDVKSIVSMNCWGFTADIMDELNNKFIKFFESGEYKTNKSEFLLPMVVDYLVKENKAEVTILPTDEKWFGVTYKEDKESVEKAVNQMIAEGKYPDRLF